MSDTPQGGHREVGRQDRGDRRPRRGIVTGVQVAQTRHRRDLGLGPGQPRAELLDLECEPGEPCMQDDPVGPGQFPDGHVGSHRQVRHGAGTCHDPGRNVLSGPRLVGRLDEVEVGLEHPGQSCQLLEAASSRRHPVGGPARLPVGQRTAMRRRDRCQQLQRDPVAFTRGRRRRGR